jgi:hypothetical protein
MVNRGVAIAFAAGAVVSVAAGAYAKWHTPTYRPIISFGFSTVIGMKAWFTTIAFLLGIGQLLTALRIWGRLPGASGEASPAVAASHRWLGTLAFLFTLPVAFHCLWSLGLSTFDARTTIHSTLGVLFYGVFVFKMCALRIRHLSSRVIPLAGGLLVTLLTALWLTSSLWYFRNVSFP